MGNIGHGFAAAHIHVKHIVIDALAGAACGSIRAYLSVWTIQAAGVAAVVDQGTWTAPSYERVHLRWEAFEIVYRDAFQLAGHDASQLADHDAFQLVIKKVGFIVGIMHIPVPSKARPPTNATKRRIGQGFEAELGLLDGNKETDNEAFLSVV